MEQDSKMGPSANDADGPAASSRDPPDATSKRKRGVSSESRPAAAPGMVIKQVPSYQGHSSARNGGMSAYYSAGPSSGHPGKIVAAGEAVAPPPSHPKGEGSPNSSVGPPKKQSRGMHPGPVEADARTAKQALLEKLLASYGSYDEAEGDDDDDGDVSGEDVFSEDEVDGAGDGALRSFPASLFAGERQGHIPKYPVNAGMPSEMSSAGYATGSTGLGKHSYHQIGPPGATARSRELETKPLAQTGRATGNRWGKEDGHITPRTKSTTEPASETSLEMLDRIRSKYMIREHDGKLDARGNQPTMAHNGRMKSPLGKPATMEPQKKPPPPSEPVRRDEKAHGAFAHLKAQSVQKESLDQSQCGNSRSPRQMSGSIRSIGSSPVSGPRNSQVAASRDSRGSIGSMDAVMADHVGGGTASSNPKMSRPRSIHPRASDSGSGGPWRGKTRDVIASIEADMMALEADTHTEDDYNVTPTQIRQPAQMSQLEVLNIMRMQQQRGMDNRSLLDQVSHMAIDPTLLEAGDEHSSDKSIASCVSYDGKCTNMYGVRAQTHEEELACHELNKAICDLYGAPVKTILKQLPMVTRLIRSDDEMANVQLHYAVRNGNVKAIRRIVRADPGCALVRNIQGYCPLHSAVHIGNFAAVQLLCSLVPASAEVQCEEGCLPLHEAVSTAAHLPDAPQITATLINTFPSAIKITNDEGLLPLHLAAMSGFSAGIRTIFAHGFSTIYARENTEEMLPLDFAIDGYRSALEETEADAEVHPMFQPNVEPPEATSEEKIQEFRHCIDIFLMSALYDRPVFTDARSEQRGIFLPIHGAAAAQPCSQSWKQIVSMYGNDYASDVDVRGRTALHVMVSSTLFHSDLVTEMIVDMNQLDPTSATTFDDSGLIPLHAALIHLAPYPVVDCLIRCNWSTIGTEVDDDCDNAEYRGMLPFQLAAACDCGVDIVNLLLRAHPTGISGALPSLHKTT